METSATLSSLLLGVASQPVLLVLVIVLATFVLEDVATITVALLASQMVIDGSIAVAALVVGTVLGDLAVFFIARRAAHVPFVARLLHGAALRALLGWLERHALAMVALARFTPGLRLPVFAGAGSIDVSARGFTIVIVLSTLVWTPALFHVANTLGMAGIAQLGGYGWLAAAGLIAVAALIPRLVTTALKRKALSTAFA